MTPRVSIIVSTYNAAAFLPGRLENLVHQTIFPQSEIIVVNSGSTQDEEEIVRRYQTNYSNIEYIATRDRETIYKAWNRGIVRARAQYIMNANTDDRTRLDGVERFAEVLDKNPHVAMVYADQYISSEADCSFEKASRGRKRFAYPFSRVRLLAGYFLGSQQMWRASLHFETDIWFEQEFEVSGDYDFACQVAERFELMHVADVLGVYYLSDSAGNKQFQDVERFLSEDSAVRQKYVRRFLRSMSKPEFMQLYEKMKMWVRIPRYGYTILHRTLERIDGRKQIMNKVFWCWLGSHMEEMLGNIEEAKALCRQCVNIPSAAIIRVRYEELVNGLC